MRYLRRAWVDAPCSVASAAGAADQRRPARIARPMRAVRWRRATPTTPASSARSRTARRSIRATGWARSALIIALQAEPASRWPSWLLDAGADVNQAGDQRRHAADGRRVRRARPTSSPRLLAKGAERRPGRPAEEDRDDLRGRRRPHGGRQTLLSRGRRSERSVYRQRPHRADVGRGLRQDDDGRARCSRPARAPTRRTTAARPRADIAREPGIHAEPRALLAAARREA